MIIKTDSEVLFFINIQYCFGSFSDTVICFHRDEDVKESNKN